MKTVFQSRGTTCDVEILGGEAAFLIRFYNSGDENYAEPLHDLVIAPSSYGFLTLKKVGGDGVLRCRDIYLPYHIDFVSLTNYDE